MEQLVFQHADIETQPDHGFLAPVTHNLSRSQPCVVDLFCGCGGFGLGAELAGFQTAIAVDCDTTLQSAYRLNFPRTQVVQADVSRLTAQHWSRWLGNQPVDGVIGGSPCQGFSRIGKQDPTDVRRSLLFSFMEQVNTLLPKFFVLENVLGLLDQKNEALLQQVIQCIDSRYCVLEPIVIDASLCGAATRRQRVFLMGYNPLQMNPLSAREFAPLYPATTVRSAISDINDPCVESNEYGWSTYRAQTDCSLYSNHLRQLPPHGLGADFAVKQLQAGYVSGHFSTQHTDAVKKRYQTVKQGERDAVSRSKRLAWSGLCPTLRAGTGSDRGGYQAVRPLHPEQDRVISVREAARLQGFPDWFVFHTTQWHSFRMIGNSVSPMVSQFVLSKCYERLERPLSSHWQ